MTVFKDLNEMHKHYGFHQKVSELDAEKLAAMLDFRRKFLYEEMRELDDAIEAGDSESVVDALIDLVVVAVGTLDLYGVDGQKAWDEVHAANMSKEVGVKASRPNPLGLPDLVKPEGWQGPVHVENTGDLSKFMVPSGVIK